MAVAFCSCFFCKNSITDHARHCPFNPNFRKFSEEDKEMRELQVRKAAYREMAQSRRRSWSDSRTSKCSGSYYDFYYAGTAEARQTFKDTTLMLSFCTFMAICLAKDNM